MEITGIVTTGLGKAAYFLGQDFYKDQFREKCGFTPFPGTLNLIVEEDKLEDIRLMKSSCKNLIKPDQGFGAVRYIRAHLNKDIEGAASIGIEVVHARRMAGSIPIAIEMSKSLPMSFAFWKYV